jgi:putative FmdB family regulatory protein
MPTYEYACKFCGKHLEIYQPITAEPLKRCPSCKKAGLQRLISGGAGLIFKGSGFYETDYKRSASSISKAAEAEKKSSEPKTETKTESKPAAKTESSKSSAKSAKT